MGQKYSEVPSVDYWVQLTRSADRAGAGNTLPIREVSRDTNFGRWEMDRFAMMQRYRTRSVNAIDRLVGDTPAIETSNACIRCGKTVGLDRRIVRQVWLASGERIDYRRCAEC